MLKIYGRANSINVRKVLWMAEELGLAYTRENWNKNKGQPRHGNRGT